MKTEKGLKTLVFKVRLGRLSILPFIPHSNLLLSGSVLLDRYNRSSSLCHYFSHNRPLFPLRITSRVWFVPDGRVYQWVCNVSKGSGTTNVCMYTCGYYMMYIYVWILYVCMYLPFNLNETSLRLCTHRQRVQTRASYQGPLEGGRQWGSGTPRTEGSVLYLQVGNSYRLSVTTTLIDG